MLPDDVARLCETQHGVVARCQLVSMGLPEHAVDDLLREGDLARLERGVYRVRGGAKLPEQGAFAAALRARPNATITGPLVLHLLGVPSFHGATTYEILRQPNRRLRGVAFPHRIDPDPKRAVTTRGSVRTAGPLDALIDSAGTPGSASARDLRVAYDHLRAKDLVNEQKLRERCERLDGLAPGARALIALLELAGGTALETEGERTLAPILGCFEPALEPQAWVTPRRRTDFYSRRCRCGWEYLGEVDHAHVAARLADDERDRELREAGIHLHYVTKADVREPMALLASVAGTLTVRAHALGVEPPVAVRPLGPPHP